MPDPVLPPNGSFAFTGRTAIVTGAGSGVGAAIARELHLGGARVAVSDRDEAAAGAVGFSGVSALILILVS